MTRKTPLAALLALATACATAGVTVRRTGVAAPPKPAGCALEVLRKPPARPHEALGDLTSHLTNVPPAGAVSAVAPAACELGADAIIVVNEMVLNEMGHVLVSVTAIRWTPQAPAEPAAAPAAPPVPTAPQVPAAPPAPAAPSGPAPAPAPAPPQEAPAAPSPPPEAPARP